MPIVNDGEQYHVRVPDGETWLAGQVRMNCDGNLGIVTVGPPLNGDASGRVLAVLDCSGNIEIEVVTSVDVIIPEHDYKFDFDTQQLVAQEDPRTLPTIFRALHEAKAGSKVKVIIHR